MIISNKLILLYLLAIAFSTTSYSAPDKEDWFCAQKLVEKISIGAIWSNGYHKIINDFSNNSVASSTQTEAFSKKILIHQNKQNAKKIIKEFAKKYPDDEQLTLLFADVFESLNKQRQEKISFVLNYGNSHKNRIKTLQETRDKIREAIKNKQTSLLKNLEEQYQWQTVIFNSRKKHNPYLCQQVVDIDGYAFFISKEIGKYMKKTKGI